MALDDIFYVRQAGVAEFYGIFVYNFVIDVIFGEMLIYEAEEFFSDLHVKFRKIIVFCIVFYLQRSELYT